MLEFKHISKKYGDHEIIHDLNITFPKKGLIGIQGESGCGKSTLLYIMGMLDHDFEGEVFFYGEKVTDQRKFVEEHVSYMMQDKDYISSLTVKENILLPTLISSQNYQKSDFQKIVKQLGIQDLLSHYPSQLSGGQQKRMSIAKALLKTSSLLLCDEPTGTLHEKQAHQVMKILKKVSKEKLVVVVSHDPMLLQQYCDFLLTLKDGKLMGELVLCQEEERHSSSKHFQSLLFYPLRQLYAQRKKLIFVFLFQSLLLMAVILMITGINGLMNALQESEDHCVQTNMMTLEKKDRSFFETLPMIQECQVDYVYQLDQLKMSCQGTLAFCPKDLQHIHLISGRLPVNKDEVIVTKKFSKLDKIHISFGEYQRDLKVVGVVAPTLFQEEEVYCMSLLKDELPFLKDQYMIEVEVPKASKEDLYQSLLKDYIVYSDVMERRESYASLLSLGKMVAYLFIGISLFVSLLLMRIVISILYADRSHDIAYLLSLGLSRGRLIFLCLLESGCLGLILAVIGNGLGMLMMFYLNDVLMMKERFFFEFLLCPLFYHSYNLFIGVGVVSILMTMCASLLSLRSIMSINMIDVLREE